MALSQEYRGRSVYTVDYVEGPHRLFVAVSCQVGHLPLRFDALLDTGSEWCVLRSDIAHLFATGGAGEGSEVLATRFGLIRGTIERLPLTFLARESEDLPVDATWFISPDWPGPMVIGWKGCLERVRFALDPDDDSFYLTLTQR